MNDEKDDPAVWMLLLERGRRIGDYDLIAEAKAQLRRLGVRVTYSRHPGRGKAKKGGPKDAA